MSTSLVYTLDLRTWGINLDLKQVCSTAFLEESFSMQVLILVVGRLDRARQVLLLVRAVHTAPVPLI